MILIYIKDGIVIRVAVDCNCRVDPIFTFDLNDPTAETELIQSEPMSNAERALCIEGKK